MEESAFEMSGIDSSAMNLMSEQKDDEQNRGGLVLLAIACLGVLAMSALGAAAFTTSTQTGSTTEEEPVHYLVFRNPPSQRVTPGKPDIPTLATREPTDMSVRTDMPSSSVATSTRGTTKAPRIPKESKRPDPESLLCTFGLSTNESTKFPADGMCDYFFFDSAYADGRNTLEDGSESFEHNLNRFLSEVPNYGKTEFGVGFAYYSRNTIADHLKQSDPTLLEVFWNKNVYHFGIIDVPVFENFDDTGVLRFLKVLADLAKTHSDYGTPSYVVVGAAIHSKTLTASFRQILSEYEPDLLISFAHYPYGDHERSNCNAMPPTALHRPFHAQGYPYDMTTAIESIESLKPSASTRTSWLTSVSMKGRWTLKLPYTSSQGIMAPCKKNTSVRYFGAYTEVCNNPAFVPHLKYDSHHEAMWAFDQNTSMFIYDNERSLCRKLCMDKAEHPSVRFGIAVFDLDYEDSSDQCSRQNQFRGGFSRLQALRKVLDYFKGFTSEAQKDGCFNLVPTE